jgi:hypothetical protein
VCQLAAAASRGRRGGQHGSQDVLSEVHRHVPCRLRAEAKPRPSVQRLGLKRARRRGRGWESSRTGKFRQEEILPCDG